MNENFTATLKSTETEDWVDLHIVRPITYYLAKGFAHFGIHPNTVTIWSMIIGASSAACFAQGSFYYNGIHGLLINLLGVVLLMIADFFDCTDGQLARMTGKKSRLGRILDGVAGFAWFGPIYVLLVYRFYLHHDIEFSLLGIENTEQNTLIATALVFLLALTAGIRALAGQQRLADYYIQAHLYFLKGEKGSELDNSQQQQEIYDRMGSDVPWYERLFQKSYVGYTQKQERRTPQFQQLLQRLHEQYGHAADFPTWVREEFHRCSKTVMPWNLLLVYNFRTFWFFLFCLVDVPMMNWVFELFVLEAVTIYTNHRHEAFCRQICEKL